MSLRSSMISNTKKFFKRTLNNFKTLFSCDSYEKLPKSPPNFKNVIATSQNSDNSSINTNEFDKFYNDFTDQWEADHRNKHLVPRKRATANHQMVIKKPKSTTTTAQKEVVYTTKLSEPISTKTSSPKKKQVEGGNKLLREEERRCLVAQKLKELEMMGISDVDHVLDVEEVVHYYSRLTCPAYLEIVDKFFMDIYGDFFDNGPSPLLGVGVGVGVSPPSVRSRPIRLIPPVS